MKYIIISIILYSIFISSWVFAQDAEVGDCRTPLQTVFKGEYDKYQNIYPKSLLDTAQKNLANYCCKNRKDKTTPETETFCQKNPTDTFAESPRLFDHLVDVGMRYLDGDPIYQYPWAPVDSNGKKRIETSRTFWENIAWWIPLALSTEFSQQRGLNNLDIISMNMSSCSDSKQRFEEEYNKKRNEVSLAQKYFIICERSICLTEWNKTNRLNICQQLAQERINNEQQYVQSLLVQQWTDALKINFDAYALWYVTREWFNGLFEKIINMVKWFGFVNSKVNEMTKMCSA